MPARSSNPPPKLGVDIGTLRIFGPDHIILAVVESDDIDSVTDEVADVNFVRGVKVRASDPRARKPRKAKRVFGWEQMHAFAAAGRADVRARTLPDGKHYYPPHDCEAMLRVFADTSMRLGEVLPLERADFKPAGCGTSDCRVGSAHFGVQRTAHDGSVEEGTKTDHGEPVPGRVVPYPPTLCRLIQERPARIDTPLLFPTPTGKLFWERNFFSCGPKVAQTSLLDVGGPNSGPVLLGLEGARAARDLRPGTPEGLGWGGVHPPPAKSASSSRISRR